MSTPDRLDGVRQALKSFEDRWTALVEELRVIFVEGVVGEQSPSELAVTIARARAAMPEVAHQLNALVDRIAALDDLVDTTSELREEHEALLDDYDALAHEVTELQEALTDRGLGDVLARRTETQLRQVFDEVLTYPHAAGRIVVAFKGAVEARPKFAAPSKGHRVAPRDRATRRPRAPADRPA
jgi:hypothetical protein